MDDIVGVVTVKTPNVSKRTLLGVVVGVAAIDIWLIAHGHQALSTTIRESPVGKVLSVVLAAHLIFSIKYDPLHHTGVWIEKKYNGRQREKTCLTSPT